MGGRSTRLRSHGALAMWRNCSKSSRDMIARGWLCIRSPNRSGTSSRGRVESRDSRCSRSRTWRATLFRSIGSLCLNLFCCRPRPEWDFERVLKEMLGASRVIVRRIERPYRMP